ncbi:hypothetical protein [Brevibacillus centrosporus]|uniref:hypothetical protein n=1 Tax=Brevibacillus centrosporus TaxID=54910 RepID=UPI002E1AF6C8|nr:hypothetical protein [Brevibacillus centrosporus]
MSDRNHRTQIVRTTGILQNNLGVALTAHLDLVNLNNDPVEVRVQVLNWGDAVTQTNPVSTLLDITQTLPGNTRMAFNATVPASFHYEVRLSVGCNNDSEGDNVLLTTYGRTAVGGGQVVGLSVLDSQFQTVTVESCF